ncbi:MAG TPA: hypothetical protein VJ952_02365 [Opitutales bacterium]|nr:hypothetical protein [Opitutales bacterium]
MNKQWQRPSTAAEVAQASHSTESFGRNLRDWQHELGKVSSRKEFAERIQAPPGRLRDTLDDSGQCDAYLAAYVEWLCERHAVPAPAWLDQPERFAEKAWYDHPPLWQESFVHAPGAFRRRGVFTRPEDVLHFRRGRPSLDNAHKRAKNAERQRRYRAGIREKLERLKALEST